MTLVPLNIEHLSISREKQAMPARYDPLEILPEEVWTSIIVETALDTVPKGGFERYDTESTISQDFLLHLTRVSCRWETKISSNPLLWVDIVLDNEYGTAAKATIALHYSKQVPISLYIVDATIWWTVESLRETIIVNKNRIRKLFFWDRKTHLIVPILVQLSPMPILEHVRCASSWDREAITSFLETVQTPLKEIENLFFNKTLLKRVDISELRSIHLQTDSDFCLDKLENASRLERVFVSSDERSQSSDIPNPSQLYRKPLRWNQLRFTDSGAEVVLSIIHRLPYLTDLRLGVDGEAFSALFIQLGAMERLVSLHLTLTGGWSDFRIPATPHVSTTISTLKISTSEYNPRLDQDIADMLFLCCPNTTLLSLCPPSASAIRTYASALGFKNLKAVEVIMIGSDDSAENLDTPVSFVNSLESIFYTVIPIWLKVVFPQQAPKVKHLTLGLLGDGALVFDPSTWPNLQTLVVPLGLAATWGTGTYRHLSSISVYEASNGTQSQNVTRICRDIALYPDCFPSVRKLRLEQCPEWDILLILLVRRNVRSTPGISAITILEIPARCPPFLIECFKAIVQGVPVNLPTYYELSLAGAFEIVRDPAIPGCVSCHRALRYCEDVQGSSVAERGLWPPIQRIEYPEDESDILQTWEVRADQWYPFEYWYPFAKGARRSWCERQFNMVTLSR